LIPLHSLNVLLLQVALINQDGSLLLVPNLFFFLKEKDIIKDIILILGFYT